MIVPWSRAAAHDSPRATARPFGGDRTPNRAREVPQLEERGLRRLHDSHLSDGDPIVVRWMSS